MSGAPNDGTPPADGGTPPAGGAGGDVTKQWYDGADAETIGYLQNRGLDKQEPKAVALAAIKSHREAEKLLGHPAKDVIRLPKDGNDPAWRSVWDRLGVPGEAKGYDFSDVKFSDDSPLDAKFSEFLQTTFHTNNVPKSAAAGVARDVVKYLEGLGANGDSDAAAQLAIEKDGLKKEWSFNYNQNMIVASNAARALGVDEETIETLQNIKGVGYAKVMEMFRSIGEKIGEDRFVKGPSGGRSGPMTVAQATEQLDSLKADKVWIEKFNSGDTEAKKQFNQLTELIASGQGARWE